MIEAKDLKLIHKVDDVKSAFDFLKNNLLEKRDDNEEAETCPAIAKAKFSKPPVSEIRSK